MCFRLTNSFINILFFIGMLFLSSCATKGNILEEVNPSNNLKNYNEAIELWHNMIALMPRETNFYSEGSWRLGTTSQTDRVSYLLWSNVNKAIKLDLNAGFTSIASAIIKLDNSLEDIEVFMKPYNLLVKQQVDINTNYYTISGINSPFSISTLTKVVQAIFPINLDTKIHKIYLDNKTLFYTYYIPSQTSSDLIDSWTLDNLGRVVGLKTDDWQITFEYKDDLRQVYKIRANSDDGYIFQMIINLIEKNDIPFNDNYFNLILPDNVKIMYNK